MAGKLLCFAVLLSIGLCCLGLFVDTRVYGVAMSAVNGDPDLDGSGIVDYVDLEVVTDSWLWCGQAGDNAADLDLDGAVDFNDVGVLAGQWLSRTRSVAIVIDSNTYSSLQTEIERLRSDIENDLAVNAFVFADDWDDIHAIKDVLIEKHTHDGLIGAILIGEIPTAYFEYQNSGATPTDRYFQDLSDKFIDSDGDGKFEREYYMSQTDVTMRGIWTGRLKPPLGRLEAIRMLQAYLDRNHSYRTGGGGYERKMLYYGSVAINQEGMTEEDYFNLVNQIDDFTGLYESDADVNAIYDPCLA